MPVGLSAQQGGNAHIYPGELPLGLVTGLKNRGEFQVGSAQNKAIFPYQNDKF